MAKRKKLKKLLKVLGAGAAIAGLGRAFMNRRAQPQGVSGSDKALFTSDAAYSGSDNMPRGIEKSTMDVATPFLGRMRGQGSNSGSVGQNIRAAYAQRMRNAITGVDGSPGMLNPVNDRIMVGRGQFKTGGTVVKTGEKNKKTKKKVGIQIRGFGKARKK